MLTRLRSAVLAWSGALVLVLAGTGLVAAANLVGDTAPTTDGTAPPPAVTTDAPVTFTDVNGDGIDDHCQDAVVADPTAAAAAMQAADTNGDGTISVSEAAHSGWIGGKNCNHGGYVSSVSHTGTDCATSGSSGGTTDGNPPAITTSVAGSDAGDQNEQGSQNEQGDPTDESNDATDGASDCSTDGSTTTTDQTNPNDQAPAQCQATTPTTPSTDQAPTDTAPNAHGKAVSLVAQSAAVGGKNCNHGGAVSAAAHQDHGQHGNAAKHANGKGHGKGHNKP